MTNSGQLITATLIALTVVVASHSARAQLDNANPGGESCTCVFTTQCGEKEKCVSGGCKDDSDIFDWKNGLCKESESTGSLQTTIQALDMVLLAYEDRGSKGGGSVDPSVLERLSGLGLSEQEQQSVHDLALSLMSLYIGSERAAVPFRPGYLVFPVIYQRCKSVCLGLVLPFQPYLSTAAPQIRQAILAELREPDKGHLENSLQQISSQVPNLLTFGRCEYPFPLVGAKFPHRDGMACLAVEMKAILRRTYQLATQ